MSELEADLRGLLTGGDPIPPERLERARRAAAYLVQHEGELRRLGWLSLGERRGDLHLEPQFAELLADMLSR